MGSVIRRRQALLFGHVDKHLRPDTGWRVM